MITSAYILSAKGSFFEAKRCEDVDYIFAHFQNWTELLYPECKEWYSGANPNQYTVVYANIKGDPAQAAAALSQSFTMAAWMSLAIHAIGVEIYVSPSGRIESGSALTYHSCISPLGRPSDFAMSPTSDRWKPG